MGLAARLVVNADQAARRSKRAVSSNVPTVARVRVGPILLHIRKGRTWVTMSVGAEKPSERFVDDAKKLAEILAKKL